MKPNPMPSQKDWGKTFEFGGCKLVCGDFGQALQDMPKVNLVFTSPPYNIGSTSERRDGYRSKGQYDPKSFGAVRSYPDSKPEQLYQQEQTALLRWLASKLVDDGSVVYNHKPRHKNRRLIKPESWFPNDSLTQVDEIVWDRSSTHNHCMAFCYQQTERLYIFAKEGCERLQYFKNSEGASDVWRIQRERLAGSGHDARFPLDLARKVIRLWSRPGDIVCDPYTGSGTTILAAYLERHRFIGAELMAEHFDEATSRLMEAT